MILIVEVVKGGSIKAPGHGFVVFQKQVDGAGHAAYPKSTLVEQLGIIAQGHVPGVQGVEESVVVVNTAGDFFFQALRAPLGPYVFAIESMAALTTVRHDDLHSVKNECGYYSIRNP